MIEKAKKTYKSLPIQVKASFWFLVCSFLQKGISFITTPIFTRIMSTSEYGNYNVFVSWENIITIFVTLNLSSGVYSQGLVKYEDDRKRYASSMQGLTFFLIAIWLIIYLVFHNFFNAVFSYSTSYMLLMLACIWIYAIFAFWAGEQRVEFKYKKLVVVTIIFSILNPVLSIILMSFMSNKVLARILGITIALVVTYFWMFIQQIHEGKKVIVKDYWIHALKFNIPLIPHYLSQVILNSSDKIMIERMVDSSTAGIYSLAYSLSLIMTLFNTALMQTISPWLYKKIKDKKIKDISKVAYPTLIIVATVNILLIAFAPEAVKIFAPSSYYDAIWIIPPVAMSVYFMFAYDLFAKFEFYFEKTKKIAIATVIGAVLNIVLNYIFIQIFGYYAAGYTTLICYMVYAICHFIFMRKVCKENCDGVQPYEIKKILTITGVFLIMGFVFLLLYNYMILRYTIIVIIAIIGIVNRKKIIESVMSILNLKKESN